MPAPRAQRIDSRTRARLYPPSPTRSTPPDRISLPAQGCSRCRAVSGIKNMKDGTFLTLTDNGFGSKANSPDAMLMFHVVKPDWKTGAVERVSTTFLHDPDRKVPFRIVNENTAKRYLTGGDFDIESIQPIGDALWFGDEFGPFLIKTDKNGKVLQVFETVVDGKPVRSPDHPATVMPAVPGPVKFDVRRSKGFEGMAASSTASSSIRCSKAAADGRRQPESKEGGLSASSSSA